MVRILLAVLLVPLVLAGCELFSEERSADTVKVPESTEPLVPVSPFGQPPPVPIARTAYTPGSADATNRVAGIGQKLVSANRQLDMQPVFLVSNFSEPGIYHEAGGRIVISEALVKQCESDGQLAAFLSLELGKMLLERAALAPQRHGEDKPMPIDVPVGTANDCTLGLVHQAELSRWDKERRAAARSLPNPEVAARAYLTRAGYTAEDLDTAMKLLRGPAQPVSPPAGQ